MLPTSYEAYYEWLADREAEHNYDPFAEQRAEAAELDRQEMKILEWELQEREEQRAAILGGWSISAADVGDFDYRSPWHDPRCDRQ